MIAPVKTFDVDVRVHGRVGDCLAVCVKKGTKVADIITYCDANCPSGTTHGWIGIVVNHRIDAANPHQCGEDESRIHVTLTSKTIGKNDPL